MLLAEPSSSTVQAGPTSIMKLLTKFIRRSVRTTLGFVGRGEPFETSVVPVNNSVLKYFQWQSIKPECKSILDFITIANISLLFSLFLEYHLLGLQHVQGTLYRQPLSSFSAFSCFEGSFLHDLILGASLGL